MEKFVIFLSFCFKKTYILSKTKDSLQTKQSSNRNSMKHGNVNFRTKLASQQFEMTNPLENVTIEVIKNCT